MSVIELEPNQVDESSDDDALLAWDDVKDVELDMKRVRNARRLEMDFVNSHKV